jgi:hypothetical protein
LSGAPDPASPREKIVRLEFRPRSNGFSALSAGVIEYFAVQRGWREFRIAT